MFQIVFAIPRGISRENFGCEINYSTLPSFYRESKLEIVLTCHFSFQIVARLHREFVAMLGYTCIHPQYCVALRKGAGFDEMFGPQINPAISLDLKL
jgi:hypothetical protein